MSLERIQKSPAESVSSYYDEGISREISGITDETRTFFQPPELGFGTLGPSSMISISSQKLCGTCDKGVWVWDRV
jgi:hypothetical protein